MPIQLAITELAKTDHNLNLISPAAELKIKKVDQLKKCKHNNYWPSNSTTLTEIIKNKKNSKIDYKTSTLV
jgi:hypothetical protein